MEQTHVKKLQLSTWLALGQQVDRNDTMAVGVMEKAWTGGLTSSATAIGLLSFPVDTKDMTTDDKIALKKKRLVNWRTIEAIPTENWKR